MIETKGFYEFGPFRIDPAERQVMREGSVVPLPPKAFDTLLFLVRNSGRILSKEELMKATWPDTFVEEASLAQNISVLRRVLGEPAGERQYIETIPRRGYRFLAQVEATRQSAEPRPAAPEGCHTQSQEELRTTWRSHTFYIAAAAATGLLVGAMISRQWFIPAPPDINSHILTPLATAPGLEVHPAWAP